MALLAHEVGGGHLPIGVTLDPIGTTVGWWLESARRLEAAGYAGVWIWDHHAARGRRPRSVLEAWTTLTATATVTRRVAVGTHVLNVGNRHPALLARMAATLQQLAEGRLVLGLGIGGDPLDVEPFGFPSLSVGERVARLEEAVGVLRALWSGGTVVREGPVWPLRGARALPVPEPRPPIVIGAQSSTGARVAARIADGWTTRPDLLARLLPAYLEALDAAGRSRGEVSVLVGWEDGRSGEDSLRGSPWVEDPVGTLGTWRVAGADGVVVPARSDRDVDALVRAVERW
jgi:alkanesulfonate monooxygenase SsuD/methylene tetrahydromethanopterin reductase-like flavin-dependent oxidoreductase (luciferase family)